MPMKLPDSLLCYSAAAILTYLISLQTLLLLLEAQTKDIVPYAAIYLGSCDVLADYVSSHDDSNGTQERRRCKSPLYTGAVLVSVNILLDWLLIFGHDPVYVWGPGCLMLAIGILGAAIATGFLISAPSW